MTVFLTGANGFLGSHLLRHWVSLGCDVRAAARHWTASHIEPVPHRRVEFELNGNIPPEDLAGVHVAVHLAYDRKAGLEANVAGVRRVFAAAEAAGVTRQIFVSSYSARPDAISEYGRLKFQLETFFLDRGQSIVRPGLVVGNGGLFGRNMETILRLPFVPLLGGGADLLPVVAVDDFVAAMTLLLNREPTAYNLFNRELVTMRELVTAINRAAGHRAFCFNVPLAWAVGALTFASKLHMPLPVDLDNLRGLKQNQLCVHKSDLEGLVSPRSFESMVQAAVAARHRQRGFPV